MAVLIDLSTLPTSITPPPAGFRTGKWKFTFTPSATLTATPVGDRFFFHSGESTIGIGGADSAQGNNGRLIVTTTGYAISLNTPITWNLAPILFTFDMPLQKITISGALTGNGTFDAAATMTWTTNTMWIGSDNNYYEGTYYGAQPLLGTMSDVEDFTVIEDPPVIPAYNGPSFSLLSQLPSLDRWSGFPLLSVANRAFLNDLFSPAGVVTYEGHTGATALSGIGAVLPASGMTWYAGATFRGTPTEAQLAAYAASFKLGGALPASMDGGEVTHRWSAHNALAGTGATTGNTGPASLPDATTSASEDAINRSGTPTVYVANNPFS